jgi:PAS domain S-box-containing protein
LSLFAVPLALAALVCAALAVYALRNRHAAGAFAFGLQMVGLFWWTASAALEASSEGLPARVFWVLVRYPGVLLAISSYLAVALQYTGRWRIVTRGRVALLSIVPAITLLLAATSPWHRLLYERMSIDTAYPGVMTVRGTWFWVHLAWCYALLLVATALIVVEVWHSGRRRGQAAALLLAALVPWAGNVVHVLGGSRLDATPFALTLSGLAFAWAIFQGFLDIVPLGRAAVLDGMPDGMLVVDARNRVLDLNPAAQALLGPAVKDAIGRPAGQVLAAFPELVSRFRDVASAEAELSLGEGEDRRHYELRVAPLRDRSGQGVGRVFVWRDITARKRAEAERDGLLRRIGEEHSRLSALVRSSRDGILVVAREPASVLVANDRALELLGLGGTAEPWLGRLVTDLLQALGESVARELRTVAAASAAEPPAEGELAAPSRTLHWLSLPVRSGEEPLGRLLVLRDVTEERALEQLRDDLTHALVHDLRNPLTVVAGALEAIESASREASPALVRSGRAAAAQMRRLVDAILEVTRLESGRMPLSPQAVALGPLVQETLALEAPLAEGKGLRLQSAIPEGLPRAWADPGLLQRVLVNLVGNAIKFTPVGGVVMVEVATDGPRQLTLSVRDSGDGVPPELLPRLFQKFATGAQKTRGSGLGLAFCRLAVEAQGGRIWVESEPEGGATFRVSLPIAG